MNKIAIIGAGRVGEQTAQFIANQNMVDEVVLIDIREGAAEGAALDIQQSSPIFNFNSRIIGGTDHSLLEGADLIVVTAGQPRKPGMSRSDLLSSNIAIIDSVLDGITRYAPDSMLLIVSNPVDVITYHALMRTGWSRNRIFGQAGVLDSSRMATFLAMETGRPIDAIETLVLGGHGDTMVPMLRYSKIDGRPLTDFLDEETLEAIVERTRKGGAEVLGLRQVSSAYNAPAASVMQMVMAINDDSGAMLPTVCMLDGEYGHADLAIGVPVRLGKGGIQEVVQLDMNDAEQASFDHSASLVRADLNLLRDIEAA